MQINFTLVIQIFHFGIICMLLDRILIRPAVQAMDEDEQKIDATNQLITQEQKTIVQLSETIDDQWLKCQEEFKRNTPSVKQIDRIKKQRITGLDISFFEPDTRDKKLVSEVVQHLKTKIVRTW